MKHSCDCCGYNTNIKRDFDKHILTPKHLKNKENNKTTEQINAELIYECKNCNKKYKTNMGLWKHKKTCIVEPKKEEPILQTMHQTTPPAPELAKETLTECFEKNKEFFMNMMIDEFKNNCGMLENQIIPYNSSNELVKFDNNNNLKNEVIQIKQEIKEEIREVKIANEITNRRIDRLERKLNFYTDNYCKDNINYDEFIENLQITNKFCKDFSEDFCDTIINLIKSSLKKLGLENSPVYYMFNTDEKVILRVKNDIWKTYYYDEMKMPGLIGEIINPLIDKLKTEIDKLSDEKIKKRNGYIQHYDMLDRPNQQKGILDYGLYEPVFLDSRKMKRLIGKKENKNNIVIEMPEENDEDNEDEEDEESEDDVNDDESEEDEDDN